MIYRDIYIRAYNNITGSLPSFTFVHPLSVSQQTPDTVARSTSHLDFQNGEVMFSRRLDNQHVNV